MNDKTGILGSVVTISTAAFGFLVKHEAELRALSFVISIVVGLLTAAWWVRRWWREFTKAAEDLEGE